MNTAQTCHSKPYKFLGNWMYPTKPDGIRPATREDFFHYGRIKQGLPFLLHSWYSNEFEAYKTTETTNMAEIQPFIDAGRCYVKNTQIPQKP